MAQGLWLGITSRLYNITGDKYYFYLATKIFNSIIDIDSSNEYWVSVIDQDNFLWLEEYPMHPLDKTLNGFMEALIYGISYYNKTFNDSRSDPYFNKFLMTINNYLEYYIEDNKINRYSLNPLVDPPLRLEHYHVMHTRLLLELYELTGDSFYKMFAERNIEILINLKNSSSQTGRVNANLDELLIIATKKTNSDGLFYIFDMRTAEKMFLPYLYFNPETNVFTYNGGYFKAEDDISLIFVYYNRKARDMTFFLNGIKVAELSVPGFNNLDFNVGRSYNGNFINPDYFLIMPISRKPSYVDMNMLSRYKHLFFD